MIQTTFLEAGETLPSDSFWPADLSRNWHELTSEIDRERFRQACRDNELRRRGITITESMLEALAKKALTKEGGCNRTLSWKKKFCNMRRSLKSRVGCVSDVKVSGKDLAQIAVAQEFRCALSGEALTTENISLDHVIPIFRGGTHEISNLQLVTKRINKLKSTFTSEEFVTICGLVADFFNEKSKSDF